MTPPEEQTLGSQGLLGECHRLTRRGRDVSGKIRRAHPIRLLSPSLSLTTLTRQWRSVVNVGDSEEKAIEDVTEASRPPRRLGQRLDQRSERRMLPKARIPDPGPKALESIRLSVFVLHHLAGSSLFHRPPWTLVSQPSVDGGGEERSSRGGCGPPGGGWSARAPTGHSQRPVRLWAPT